jgi:hypothetical protein
MGYFYLSLNGAKGAMELSRDWKMSGNGAMSQWNCTITVRMELSFHGKMHLSFIYILLLV